MRAIITKFLPCTDTKGSRIKADAGKQCTITIPYPHELDSPDAHLAAAQALCGKMKWPGRPGRGNHRALEQTQQRGTLDVVRVALASDKEV
jgi:hypothetical protein